ncbi:MAG TPA: WGxxGxxG family protein, partial [Deinococcales bacterium]|nr:WGxxGxxG family protein [Deinococcales bacterium]
MKRSILALGTAAVLSLPIALAQQDSLGGTGTPDSTGTTTGGVDPPTGAGIGTSGDAGITTSTADAGLVRDDSGQSIGWLGLLGLAGLAGLARRPRETTVTDPDLVAARAGVDR